MIASIVAMVIAIVGSHVVTATSTMVTAVIIVAIRAPYMPIGTSIVVSIAIREVAFVVVVVVVVVVAVVASSPPAASVGPATATAFATSTMMAAAVIIVPATGR